MARTATRPRPSMSGAVIFYGQTRSVRRTRSKLAGAPRFSQRLRNKKLADSGGQLVAPPCEQVLPASSSASSLQSKKSNDDHSHHLISSLKPSVGGLLPSVTSTGILALAKDISLLFSHVPYIQVISSVVQQIVQISNDVQVNKNRTRELTDKVMIYASVIFDALRCSQMNTEQGLSGLESDLLRITSVLESIYKMLQSLADSSLSSHINLVLQRQELLDRLNEQDRRLDTLITSFQLKSSIVLRANANIGAVEAPTFRQQPARSYAQPTRLRGKPRLFGRDNELKHIVTIVQEASPARIAILGSGGIGKTSLALCLLHDEKIAAQFQHNRLFVSCEAAGSADHIIDDLVLALQIPPNSYFGNPLEVVLDHLGKSPHLIVLDNLETPWESLSARAHVENLLLDLTSLDSVTLVVTMRGSQRPSTVHWSELLPPLPPVSLDAAVNIFTSISRKSDDFAVRLVKVVDCIPLAVTLLANLASVDGETTESLWQRWCAENVAVVENGNDRLSSFEASIEMSLSSPRMRRDDEPLRLLSFISLLPDEISSQTVQAFENGIPGIVNVKKGFSTLLQNALIHKDATGCIRILSPIRLHMRARHPPSAHARRFLQDYFLSLVDDLETSHDPSASKTFRAQYGNIEAMLLDSLEVPFGRPVEDVVETILVFCQMAYTWGVSPTHAITLAAAKLADRPPGPANPVKTIPKPRKGIVRIFAGLRPWKVSAKSFSDDTKMDKPADETAKLRADCFGCLGQLLSRQARFEEAESSFAMAIQLHVQAGDTGGHAYDLHNMALLFSRHPDTVHRAEAMFKEALALHEEISDHDGVAHDLMGLGQLLLQQNHFVAAKEPFMLALQEFTSREDEIGQCAALNNLGHAVLSSSKPSDAEVHFSQALELSTRKGDVVGQTESLAGLACTLLLRTRFSEAKEKIERAISMRLPAENPDHLHILGRVNVAVYNFEVAKELFRRAETLHLQMKDERGCAEDRLYLLQIDFFQGQLLKGCDRPLEENVMSFYKRLDERFSSLGPHGLSDPRLITGTIRLHTVDLYGGGNLIQKLWNEDDGERGNLGSGFYHYQMGCYYLRSGLGAEELDMAESNFKEALRFHEETENVQGQADDYNKLAEVFLRKDRAQEALSIITSQALRLHVQIGDIGGQGDDLRIQACIFLEQAWLNEAEESIRRAFELHTQSQMVLGQGLALATLSSVLWQRYLQRSDEALAPAALPTDTSAEALDALERAADIFASFVADTELRQCQAQYRDMLPVKPDLKTTSKALLTPMWLYDHKNDDFELIDSHCQYR